MIWKAFYIIAFYIKNSHKLDNITFQFMRVLFNFSFKPFLEIIRKFYEV